MKGPETLSDCIFHWCRWGSSPEVEIGQGLVANYWQVSFELPYPGLLAFKLGS